jgi:hypothetical protein
MEENNKIHETDINQGKWTADEHSLFLEAYFLFGHQWRLVQSHIKTRNCIQIRCHWQKFFRKLKIKAKKYNITKILDLTKDIKKALLFDLFGKINLNNLLVYSENYDINLCEKEKALLDEVEKILLNLVNIKNKSKQKSKNEDMLIFDSAADALSSSCSLEESNFIGICNSNTILSSCMNIKKEDSLSKNSIFNIKKLKPSNTSTLTNESIYSEKNNKLYIDSFRNELTFYQSKIKGNKNTFQKPSPKKVFQLEPDIQLVSTQVPKVQVKSFYLTEESPGQSFFRKCNFVQLIDNNVFENNTFNCDFSEAIKKDAI